LHTVWHNDRGAAAHLEQAKKKMEKKDFGFPAL